MLGFVFPLSGDPEKDAETAAAMRRQDRNYSEGMCPNGCAPLVWADAHHSDCPVCKFHGWTNQPYGGLRG